MTGTPEGSTESGFMEKPGFEGIALIHYTTGLERYLVTQVDLYQNCFILNGISDHTKSTTQYAMA